MSLITAFAITFGIGFLATLLGSHKTVFVRAFCLGLTIAILVQLVAQGPYWQLVPLYLVTLLAPFFAFAAWGSFARRLSVTIAGVLLIGCSLAFAWVLPLFRLPDPTGPHPIGTRILHLIDPSRPDTGHQMKSGHRELMVQAWYPIDADQAHGSRERYRRPSEVTRLSSYMTVIRTHSISNAPISTAAPGYPVILFNPAWKGPRTECEYLMEDLASRGFIVISIDHTYNSAPISFPDGTRTISAPGPDIDDFTGRDLADQQRQGDLEVRLQAQDNSFLLDELTRRKTADPDLFYKRFMLDRVGVLGHSFGGATALQTAYNDTRVLSAINMDGWTFGDPASQMLRKPTMQMDEQVVWPTAERLRIGDRSSRIYWQFSAENVQFRQKSIAANGGYTLEIKGSRHMNFADRSLYSPLRGRTDSGTIAPQRAHEIVRAYVYAFFAQTLLDQPQQLLDQQHKPDADVTFTRFNPPGLAQ